MKNHFLKISMIMMIAFWAGNADARTFTLNSNLDTIDDVPGNGVCDDGAGHCTLRAAIGEANATPEEDTIEFNTSFSLSPLASYPFIMNPLTIQPSVGQNPVTTRLHIDAAAIPVANSVFGKYTDGLFHLRGAEIYGSRASAIDGRDITLSQCFLHDNVAQFNGGAIVLTTGNNSVSDCIFFRNRATDTGGAIQVFGGSLTLNRAGFFSNSASSSYGGAVSLNSSPGVSLIANNVTFANNSASYSGAIHMSRSVNLSNVTFLNNTPTNLGGSPGTAFTVNNSIFSQEGGRLNCNIGGVSIISSSHNIVSDSTCSLVGTGDRQNATDLGLMAIGSDVLPIDGVIRLPASSSAINAGDNASCAATDQRGYARARSSENSCDVGAFEVVCGDHVLDTAPIIEECDDGNTSSYDGCSNICQTESLSIEPVTVVIPQGGTATATVPLTRNHVDDNVNVGVPSGLGVVLPPAGIHVTAGGSTTTSVSVPVAVDEATASGSYAFDIQANVTPLGSLRSSLVRMTVTVAPATCGDGVRQSPETCDDGNLTSGDGCDNNCTVTACGNGVVTTGEVCDDGNAAPRDGCSATCASESFELAAGPLASIVSGSQGSTTVTATCHDFDGTVNVTAGTSTEPGLSFDPLSIVCESGTGSSTMVVHVASTVADGAHTLALHGVSATIPSPTDLSVVVNVTSPPPPASGGADGGAAGTGGASVVGPSDLPGGPTTGDAGTPVIAGSGGSADGGAGDTGAPSGGFEESSASSGGCSLMN